LSANYSALSKRSEPKGCPTCPTCPTFLHWRWGPPAFARQQRAASYGGPAVALAEAGTAAAAAGLKGPRYDRRLTLNPI